MEEGFKLPVLYKGEELEFESKLVALGYTFRFQITIDEDELVFEKDNEGSFRVINYNPSATPHIDTALLEAVITSLEKITE
jgi:hypothetical protein